VAGACEYGNELSGSIDHWGDQDAGGRIKLRWIFRKLEGVVGGDIIVQSFVKL
jgi:hypothetical protein